VARQIQKDLERALVLQPVAFVTADGETIGALCTKHPLALPVLQQLGVPLVDPSAAIDACCAAGGVSTVAATTAIAAAEAALAASWLDRSIDELIDAVVRSYHRPFALELAKVTRGFEAARDASGHPAWSAMLDELAELEVDLSQHIEMEERVVFPWLRVRMTASASLLIRAMQLEHGDAIAHLLVIELHARRWLAEDATSACAELAMEYLRHFERWLCEHIHLEANALFPRALELARS
jgi:iron-sulfur cluster repair protein YtfE (RIC family)